MVQLEEAYARATVAITRARYGAGHVWAGRAHFYLHDQELSRSPPDESFIDMLKQNCCLSGPHFPPPAIGSLTGLCHQLSQGTAVASHCGGLVAAMEVQYCSVRAITDQLWLIRDCDGESISARSP